MLSIIKGPATLVAGCSPLVDAAIHVAAFITHICDLCFVSHLFTCTWATAYKTNIFLHRHVTACSDHISEQLHEADHVGSDKSLISYAYMTSQLARARVVAAAVTTAPAHRSASKSASSNFTLRHSKGLRCEIHSSSEAVSVVILIKEMFHIQCVWAFK